MVFRAFIRNVADVENLCIGCVRTDEGTEFKIGDFEGVLDQHMIRHEYTVPGTPQLNGKVERAIALIAEKGLVMMNGAGLGDRLGLWAVAHNMAITLTNLCLKSATPQWKSLYEMVYGVPTHHLLPLWASKGFTRVDQRMHMLAPRAEPCLMMGCSSNYPSHFP
ncbi:unnamed protein product [Choristocarpus tenellus]